MFRLPFLLFVGPLLAASAAGKAQTLQVQVSIEPLRYLVERVGGEHVDVGVVVQAGQPPETYEPTPRQIVALTESAVFFGVGMPLEADWRKLVGDDVTRGPEWVDLGTGLVEPKDGYDPHVWLSPLNAQHMAAMIRKVLGRLLPQHAENFDSNAAGLQKDLELLHDEITLLLKESGVSTFLVFHPAWGYFAHAYGLRQLAIESGGKEPGPRALIEVIRKAKEERIRTLFLDPRHNTRLAETIAAAIDGEIRMLDPLSYDYINNLRSAAQAIAASRS